MQIDQGDPVYIVKYLGWMNDVAQIVIWITDYDYAFCNLAVKQVIWDEINFMLIDMENK